MRETTNMRTGVKEYIAGGILGCFYGVIILFAISRVTDIDDLVWLILLPTAPILGLSTGLFLAFMVSGKSRRFRLAVALTPLLSLLVTALFPSIEDGPRDSILIATFHTHRSTFDRIETALEHGQKPSQSDLSELKCKAVEPDPYPPHEISFPIWSYGAGHLVAPEDYKGFAYCKSPIPDVHEKMFGEPNYSGILYRHLEGRWYIYYEHEGS